MESKTICEIIPYSLDILGKEVKLADSSIRVVASRSFKSISDFYNQKQEIYYNESLMSELKSSYQKQLQAKRISRNVYNLRIRGVRIVQEVYSNGSFFLERGADQGNNCSSAKLRVYCCRCN